MSDLRAHQLLFIFMCAAIGALFACAFLNTIQALGFGLITGVVTYSLLISRAEQESKIKFNDYDQPAHHEQAPGVEVVKESTQTPQSESPRLQDIATPPLSSESTRSSHTAAIDNAAGTKQPGESSGETPAI